MNRVEKEVKCAYADCWIDDFDIASKVRNLEFRASTYISKAEAIEIFNKYVQGYNNFEPDLLEYLPDDSEINIAREGSVCIYVHSNKLAKLSHEQIALLQEQMFADEFTVGTYDFRIWWD